VDGKINTSKELAARAAALRDAGRPEAAAELYLEMVARDPHDPEPHHHLGALRAGQGRLDEAEAAYRRALALAPGAAGTQRLLATLLLSQGRFAEGFALFEARHLLPGMGKPDLPFPEWRGEDLAGKRLLIWPEQGFGDQIQFARFAPILQARGVDVTLLCRPALARLFAGSLGVRVLAAEGSVDFPDPDGWVMAGSLAGRLGITPQTVPGRPYLRASSAWPRRLAGDFKIGLATRGNPAFVNDANRSLPPAQAARLERLPGAVVDLDPARTGAGDFADTAALIDQLDLVIAVDTAVAHLAGAMGKPCWLLLSALGADWRWLRERTDTPWYPSMRLFRQSAPGDWDPVLQAVERALAG